MRRFRFVISIFLVFTAMFFARVASGENVVDPIYFYRDARVTMQQIGYLAPHSRANIIKNNRTLYRAGLGLVAMNYVERRKV